MSMRRSTRIVALLAACGCWLSASAFAQAAAVTARLEPDTIAADQAATLAITTDGAARPEVPEIAGVDIRPIGTQTSMTVTNGVGVQTATYLYSVQATRPGDYDLSGIHAGKARAPTLSLHVRAAGSLPPPAPAAARTTPAAHAAGSVDDAKLAFMRLHVAERRIYTSQSVPFTVKAYFRGGTGVTVRGRPELSSDAFTVSGLDEDPDQRQTSIDGVPYLAVTWRGSLTAAKAGSFPLAMTLPVSMQYREQAPAAPTARTQGRSLRDLFGGRSPFGGSSLFGPGSPFDSLFNDPFFDSMLDEPLLNGFGQLGRMVNRDIDLHGRAGTARVEALPAAGRPADFGGAVGRFDIDAQLAQPTLTQGEPVDLQLSVRGTGNFGQFSAPTLPDSSDWKAYAGHTSFSATDKIGLHGKLSLQQPIAALHAGRVSVPALRFSYFDPDRARYVTKTTPPISVDVAAAQAAASASAQAAPQAGSTTAAADSSNESQRTGEVSVRSLARGGVPAWLLPSALALLALSIASSAVIGWRRSARYRRRKQRLQRQRAFAEQLREMQRAERSGDRVAYLRAGRAALQRRLAARWDVPPESISVRELAVRWPDAPHAIRQLLELADEADYGGDRSRQPSPDFASWARGIDQQLAHMEIPS